MSVDTFVMTSDGCLPSVDSESKKATCKIFKLIKEHRVVYPDIYSNEDELDKYAYEVLQIRSSC